MNDKKIGKKIIEVLKSIHPDKQWLNDQVSFLRNSLRNETLFNLDRNALQETKKQSVSFFTLIFNFLSMQGKNVALYTVLGIAGIVLGGVTVAASNTAKPGDFLYGVDRAAESVQIAFGGLGGSQAQAEIYLTLSDERIDEIEALTGKSYTVALVPAVYAEDSGSETETEKEVELSDKEETEVGNLVNDYSKSIEKADELAQKLEDKAEAKIAKKEALLVKITEITIRHQEVLLRVYDKVPEQAKEAILRAMENSQKGHKRAMEAISGERKQKIQEKLKEKKEKIEQKIQERKEKALEKREKRIEKENKGNSKSIKEE